MRYLTLFGRSQTFCGFPFIHSGGFIPITKEIAMRNRKLGEAFEFRQLRHLRSSALEICRSAGSHGMFDIWMLTKNKLRLIQVKRNGYMKIKERNQLKDFLLVAPKWIQLEVHIYVSPKKIKKIRIRKPEDLDRLNKVTHQ